MAIDLSSEQYFIAVSKTRFSFFLFDDLKNTVTKKSLKKKYLMRKEEITWWVFAE